MNTRQSIAPGISLRDRSGSWIAILDLQVVRPVRELGGKVRQTGNLLGWKLPGKYGEDVSAARYITEFFQNVDGTPITLNI